MWMIVVLLGIVIILYASMLPRAPERKAAPEDLLDSVGDTLQHFADEIEEENKELLRMVGDMKREHEQRTQTLLSRIEQLEKRAAEAPEASAGRIVAANVPAELVAGASAPAEGAAAPTAAPAASVMSAAYGVASATSANAASPAAEAPTEAAGDARGVVGSAAAPERLPIETPSARPSGETSATPARTSSADASTSGAAGYSRFANTVRARYKELFDLHDSGKSIEYIAKKLGKNKGEVQLIIGLARQEEPQHGQP